MKALEGFRSFPFQKFPPLLSAIAYGSAAFPQAGRKAGEMLDLLLVLPRGGRGIGGSQWTAASGAVHWHEANLDMNPGHYRSFVAKVGGGERVGQVQRWRRPKVWFNPNVEIPMGGQAEGRKTIRGRLCKYGVTTLEDLESDLTSWDDLYLAGRLHKPVEIFVPPSDPRTASADFADLSSLGKKIEFNRLCAVGHSTE
uniref:Phosphatidate cytidylyltransferase, mitochondrial n=1 Tax=Chromera velia CCMP2878 TaxID=1169474 RepID=A0A0G4FBE0_9ALVE|eukprot:Cvel_16138.t1-p1 / transcript=Cvel_16138.t1 / gene=Cvel_16138 / organism=Chromera_velia_CCMP2878 / gene_product=Mitochondrial translocator assembly and maintenance, putative / transcript_product=Mitochondrial translocator assembly and maintenance, putative / location=Cvel_scaffold1229:388-2311(-) / protein_length=197 / sequence_SO=supercontig / SO=protein_coding / is_pseudo=false